jgi:hypothetical protein
MTLGGAFLQDGAGLVSTAGDITTTDDAITFTTATTLTGNVLLDTGAGLGTITFTSTLDGSTADYSQTLGLTAGTGSIVFGGVTGGAVNGKLGIITITSAADVTATTISAQAINQVAGTGTTIFNGAVATLGTLVTDGLDLNGTAFTINGAVNTGTLGTVTITNSGLLTIGAGGDMTLGGAFLQDGAGLVSTAGDITTTDDNISFNVAVTLTGDVLFSTGSAGTGDITFPSTLDDTTAGADDITLSAGTGNIVFTGAVGGTISLGAITINSAADVTATSTISAASFTQTAGTGTTTFNALLSTTGNVSVTTGVITLNAPAGAGTININANLDAGDVTLNAQTGAITSSAADTDIIARNLYLSAATGIGSTDALLTQVSGLQARNSTSGNIRINNTGTLDVIGSGITNTNGSVYLTTVGELTLAGTVTASYLELTAQVSITDDDDSGSDDVVSSDDAILIATNGGTIGATNPLEVKIGGRLYIGVDGMANTISAAFKGTTSDGIVHLLYNCPGMVIFNGSIIVFNGAQQIMQGWAQLNPYIANTIPAYMAMTLFTTGDYLIKPRPHPIE